MGTRWTAQYSVAALLARLLSSKPTRVRFGKLRSEPSAVRPRQKAVASVCSYARTSTIIAAVIIGTHASPVTAQTSGPTLASAATQQEPDPAKQKLSLSDELGRPLAPLDTSIVITPTGDWQCCAPPSGDDLRLWSPRHPNAPQTFGAGMHIGGRSASFSVGAVGSRSARLPLFVSTILANPQTPMPMPDVSSLSDLAQSNYTWQVIAAARKNLFTSQGGVTVGVAGDVFIPVGSQSSDIVPQNPVIPSRAVRFGVTLGF